LDILFQICLNFFYYYKASWPERSYKLCPVSNHKKKYVLTVGTEWLALYVAGNVKKR